MKDTGIDFQFRNTNSNFGILVPLTAEAEGWLNDHTDPAESMWWGHGLVVEYRYAEDILNGLVDDGFTFKVGASLD